MLGHDVMRDEWIIKDCYLNTTCIGYECGWHVGCDGSTEQNAEQKENITVKQPDNGAPRQ